MGFFWDFLCRDEGLYFREGGKLKFGAFLGQMGALGEKLPGGDATERFLVVSRIDDLSGCLRLEFISLENMVLGRHKFGKHVNL